MAQQGSDDGPTLNLNKVEAEELKEDMYASGQKVAGATHTYTGEGMPAGTGGFAPVVPTGDMAGAGSAAGEQQAGGVAKVKAGIKEALGLSK